MHRLYIGNHASLNVHYVDLLKSVLNQIKMHLYLEMRAGLLPDGRERAELD